MLPAEFFHRELGLPIELTGEEFELLVAVSPPKKTCKHLILKVPIMSQALREFLGTNPDIRNCDYEVLYGPGSDRLGCWRCC